MALLKWLLIAAIVAYGGLVAGLYVTQRSILYPVPQTQRTSPAAADFPQAEEHSLTTADGEKVIVWHVPAKVGRPVVIFFHGNGDILAWRVSRFRDLTADGTGLVALSFRGYAGSTGHPTEEGLLRDADAAYSFAAERYAADRIVVWGFSLGSGAAVAVASKQPVRQLILEAPYTSTVDIAASLLPFVPVRWLMQDQFRSDERIRKVKVPLLIMHGARDAAISVEFGERLFELAHEPKWLVRFPEGGHENLDAHGAVATVRQFINDGRGK